MSEVDDLQHFADLHKSGQLSDAEFAREKAKVIGATGGLPQHVILESAEGRAARSKREADIDRGRRTAFLFSSAALVLIVVMIWLLNRASSSAYTQSPQTSTQQQGIASKALPDTSVSDTRPVVQSTNWAYRIGHDDMRNADTYYAELDADDLLYFGSPYDGGARPSLMIRKSPKYGIDAILTITKGQFNPNYYNPIIAAKFDNGKVQHFSVSEPSDGSSTALFIQSSSRFIDAISRSKHVTIEAPFYQEGSRQIQFNTAGFSRKDWLAK